MSDDIKEIVDMGFEGAFVVFLLMISYKLYKMKCDLNSSCFKKDDNGITIETHNSGGDRVWRKGYVNANVSTDVKNVITKVTVVFTFVTTIKSIWTQVASLIRFLEPV